MSSSLAAGDQTNVAPLGGSPTAPAITSLPASACSRARQGRVDAAMLRVAAQRSAQPQLSLRFPAEDRFYFNHEVVDEAAKKAAKASKRLCNGPTQAPTGPTQQPRSHTASSLKAWAQHSPPAKRGKRTKAEQAAEHTQPTKGNGKAKGKAAKAKPA
ncbi:hypothetical protein QJQ45_003407 [Haematococcus lacustris]|nr:hypothetical protein QJQ45_003407 [Haematococcus lacustris]